MSELIKPEDEPVVRLLVFGAALVAIATRENVLQLDDDGIPTVWLNKWVKTEAHAIADAVIEEAERLQTKEVP